MSRRSAVKIASSSGAGSRCSPTRSARDPGARAERRPRGKGDHGGSVGFILAPRLNALGRLDRAIRGVDLLLADRDEEALGIARVCEELNRERQDMDKRILDEAMRRVERLDLDTTYGIVLADPSWHPGVIGIVASRVVEQTSRPTFLIALQDGVGKDRGRSIPAFDLHSALAAVRRPARETWRASRGGRADNRGRPRGRVRGAFQSGRARSAQAGGSRS